MASYPDNVIAQGALTNSKRPESFVMGVYPTHATKGQGCYLYADNKRFIDYICGLGTNYFGYGNSQIANVISTQARFGISLSLGSRLEVEVGQDFKNLFHVERVKIFKTGTEGCIAAVKIARAYNPNKLLVLSEGYHGWSDTFVGLTEPALGVSRDRHMHKLPQDLGSICWSDVAAVIVEPIITDFSVKRVEWLKSLERYCRTYNVCLIFDETITAYRFPNYCTYQYFDLSPDIVIMGKALANGLPISIVGGSAKYMDNDYFTSGSFCGEMLSLAVAKECMRLVQTEYKPDQLWREGTEFLSRFNKISEHIRIDGYPTRGVFVGNPIFKPLFWQEACTAGILFGPSWFYSKALHKEMDNVINICQTIVSRINAGEVSLRGKIPVQPFAQKVRE